MWPWADQPDIRTLREEKRQPSQPAQLHGRSTAERRAGASSTDDGPHAQATTEGPPTLALRAPGAHGGSEGSDGTCSGHSFSVPADLSVDGELLDLAVGAVRWLKVRFPTRDAGQPPTAAPPPPFPSWVFRLRDLRGLSLEYYPHPALPEDIGDLSNLERLHGYGSALERVPRSIGRLRNLRELDLYTSYRLHYLPFEVLRCRNLRESRFSTRALYANRKNDLPLPPLDPWWARRRDGGGADDAPTLRAIREVVVRLGPVRRGGSGAASSVPPSLPADIVDRCVLPFLPWNFCSVCGEKYAHGLGRHAWSRRRVATDTQALLAFCCSASCAGSVRQQLWFDSSSGANLPLPSADTDRLDCDDVSVVSRRAKWLACSSLASRRYLPRATASGGFEAWAEKHLLPWDAEAPPPFVGVGVDCKGRAQFGNAFCGAAVPVGEKTMVRRVGGVQLLVPHKNMRVVASGDIREEPSSSANTVGRLHVGETIRVDARCLDGNGREFVRFCRKNPVDWKDTQFWTATTKKDGTKKLA